MNKTSYHILTNKKWQFKLQHSHPRTNFILISGKTGTIIGRPYLVQTCTDISTLNITTELSLQFDCVSDVGRKNLCLFLLHISTSVWVLRTPNARRKSHFQRFCCKKNFKKQEISINFQQISAKNGVFFSLSFSPFLLIHSCKPKNQKTVKRDFTL